MKQTFTLIFLLLTSAAFAQVPNGGFENWTTTGGYDMPDGWDNLNPVTSIASTYTCEKGVPGNPGSSYLKLTSKTVTSLVSPGVAVCGKIDVATKKPKTGFAYANRPATLVGKWQYMASGADQGNIGVFLTKWNTSAGKRDTIAYKIYSLPGMVMSWTDFSITLDYVSGSVPDSAIIGLSSSGLTPVAGSYLYVDGLDLTGNVPVGVTTVTKHPNVMSIYPNPAKNLVMVDLGKNAINDLHVVLTDMMGKVIKNETFTKGQQVYIISTSGLATGVYYLKAEVGDETMKAQKLMIQE